MHMHACICACACMLVCMHAHVHIGIYMCICMFANCYAYERTHFLYICWVGSTTYLGFALKEGLRVVTKKVKRLG